MKKEFGMKAGPFELYASTRTQDMRRGTSHSLSLKWRFEFDEFDIPETRRRNDERKIWRRLFG